MRKLIVVGIVAIAIIAIVILFLGSFNLNIVFNNLLPSSEEAKAVDPTNADINVQGDVTDTGFSDREIHQAICFLLEKDLPFTQHQVYVEGLHMKMWGIDGTTAVAVLNEYEIKNANDGYTSYRTGVKRGIGWTTYTELWYNEIGNARAITVGDGSSVCSAYGYDVVLLTSYGHLTDYYDYITFLNSY